MTTIDEEIENLMVNREGGYVNDPSDRGGETNHGIAIAVARNNGYKDKMIDLTIDEAKRIYRCVYWHRPGFDLINMRSNSIALKLFDVGVLCGTRFASITLQRILNVMNNGGKLYDDIVDDGLVGNQTAQALKFYLTVRGADGVTEMLKCINTLQGARFFDLAERDEKQERFFYGWIKNRLD